MAWWEYEAKRAPLIPRSDDDDRGEFLFPLWVLGLIASAVAIVFFLVTGLWGILR